MAAPLFYFQTTTSTPKSEQVSDLPPSWTLNVRSFSPHSKNFQTIQSIGGLKIFFSSTELLENANRKNKATLSIPDAGDQLFLKRKNKRHKQLTEGGDGRGGPLELAYKKKPVKKKKMIPNNVQRYKGLIRVKTEFGVLLKKLKMEKNDIMGNRFPMSGCAKPEGSVLTNGPPEKICS